jgi:hypothetical protein
VYVSDRARWEQGEEGHRIFTGVFAISGFPGWLAVAREDRQIPCRSGVLDVGAEQGVGGVRELAEQSGDHKGDLLAYVHGVVTHTL